jgi:hypothetical protein
MNLGIYGGISICFLMRYRNSEFWNRNSNFLTLQTPEFKKYFPTGIFGIKNGIGIPLTMEVPEIGTKIRIPNLALRSKDLGGTPHQLRKKPPTIRELTYRASVEP